MINETNLVRTMDNYFYLNCKLCILFRFLNSSLIFYAISRIALLVVGIFSFVLLNRTIKNNSLLVRLVHTRMLHALYKLLNIFNA